VGSRPGPATNSLSTADAGGRDRCVQREKTPLAGWPLLLLGAAAFVWMVAWAMGSLITFVLDSSGCSSPGCSSREGLVMGLVLGLDGVWLFGLPFTWIRKIRRVQTWGLILAFLLPALTWYLLVGLFWPFDPWESFSWEPPLPRFL
jgi:hypothetical protein